MGNLTERNPHIIDTASSTPIITGAIFVKRLRWVGATTAGHTCEVQDKNGRVLWASVASVDKFVDESNLDTVWTDGYKVTTLASGKVYVYFG